MTITEPMTFFTDILLAALVLAWGCRLRRRGEVSARLWGAAFFASAFAAAAGGIVHGFGDYLGDFGKALLWKGTLYAVGLAGFFMLAGAIRSAFVAPWRRILTAAAAAKFLLYAFWMSYHDQFIYVILDYAPTMLVILLLQLFLFEKGSAAPWIVAGILVSFAAAGIQAGGLRLHEHFNHNDLYHVVQMVGFYLLYRGGRLLKDR